MNYKIKYKTINKLGKHSKEKSENVKDCKSKDHAEQILTEKIIHKFGKSKVSRISIIKITKI